MGTNNVVATMFFRHDLYGWSESHVWADDGTASLSEVLAEAISAGGLCDKRSSLLGEGAEFLAVRVSKDGVWRDSLIEEAINNPTLSNRTDNSVVSAGFAADAPYSVTSVRVEMGEQYRGIIYLSGMPAALQPDPPLARYPAPWGTAWQGYINYLSNQSRSSTKWGTFVTGKPTVGFPAASVTPVPAVADFTYNAGGSSLVLKLGAALINPLVGSRIRLLGVKALTGIDGKPTADGRKWNGRFIVTAVTSPTNITIKCKDTISTALPALDWSGATVFLPSRFALPYTNVFWDGQTHRKRGQVFGGPHGRSRKAK